MTYFLCFDVYSHFFQSASASVQSAVISEVHGLISDMLADPSVPEYIASNLNAISTLLKV